MRIDSQLSMFKAILSALCLLLFAGCGGGDSAATGTSAEPSSATQAVENEVESRMNMEVGAAGGGHDAGQMAGGGENYSYESGGQEMAGDPGMTGEPGMEYEMEDDGGMYSGGGSTYNQQMNSQQNGQRRTTVVSRPADVMQWTSEQVLAAVEEKDETVLQAIQAKAAGSQGDPEFAQLMTQVLQKSSGQQTEAAGAGFGIPGLGSLFGGGAPASGGAEVKASSRPKIAPGGVPPGGAFYVPQPQRIIPSPVYGVDSLEMMIGEAVLTYVPQAVQGSRQAADRLQGAASGHDAAGGGMAVNSGGQASGHDAASGAMAAPGMSPAANASSGHDAPAQMGSTATPMGNTGYSEMGMEYENGSGMGYDSGQPRTTGTLQDEELVRTVVKALITNNSAPAWATIKGVVNGDVASPLPRPLNTEIVLAEVFSAAAPNTAVASELLTTAARNVVADPIENRSTLRFLAALAQRPTDHFMMLAKPMPPSGMAPGPNGMNPAGMGQPGMNQPGMDPAGMNAMGVPGQPNAAMMGNVPGAEYMGDSMPGEQGYEDGFGAPPGGRPPGPPPGGLPPVRVSEAGMAIVANVLWNKASVMAVASQLQAADSPASVPEALALASTMPSDAVRHAMFTLFEKTHGQGAMGMTSSGLFRDVARDPGLLTVLKALPRSRAKKPAVPNINGPVVQANPEDSWVAATQDVVLSLRDRLRDVADDPNLAFDGQQPVRLHQGAVPERSIMIRVPGKQADELGASSPSSTTMYYSVCRVTPQRASEMQKIVDHYEKRSKGIKREDRSKGILWYDGGKVNEDGTRTSMDVVVQQVGFKPQRQGFNGGGGPGYEGGGYDGGGGGAAAGPVQFTIEVVVVVARDPKTAPIDNAVSSR